MGSGDESIKPVLKASSEVLRRRRMMTSVRELVPPRAELVRKQLRFTPSDRRKLRQTADTMTSQIAMAAIQDVAMNELQSSGSGALQPLFDSDVIKDAMSAAVRRRKLQSDSEEPAGFRRFWSSRSAVLELRRDDLNKLRDLPGVGAVYPNRHINLPPIMEVKYVPDAVAENKTSAWGVERIGALASWGVYGTKGRPDPAQAPVKVAVLDTGVDPTHPELKGKIKHWAEFDGEGKEVANSKPHDSSKHGTHVCGIIAGSRHNPPSSGHPIIGVAPEVEVAAGLVLKGGSGTYAQILAGMEWAIETGAEVINMSFGSVGFTPDVADIYARTILNANLVGIPVVVAIGNEGAQTSGTPGNDYFAFAVGATDIRDRIGGFSGGRTQVIEESRYISGRDLPLIYSKPEVSAPGVAVRSCVPGNKYEVWNGTSMATPHVAGALALLLATTDIRSIPAWLRAFVLQDLLTSSAEELGEYGQDHRFGFGRINVLRAITLAKELGY